MKRIIIAMILVLGFQFSQAQTVRTLFNEFRGEENATCVKVSWLPIRLLGLFVDDEAGQIVKRISSIRVLEVSDSLVRCKSVWLRSCRHSRWMTTNH